MIPLLPASYYTSTVRPRSCLCHWGQRRLACEFSVFEDRINQARPDTSLTSLLSILQQASHKDIPLSYFLIHIPKNNNKTSVSKINNHDELKCILRVQSEVLFGQKVKQVFIQDQLSVCLFKSCQYKNIFDQCLCFNG